MDKERLNELLDRIYELEGLVHLAIVRDDVPASLPELIRRKARQLYAEIDGDEEVAAPVIVNVIPPEPEPVVTPESEPEPEPAVAPEPVVMPEPEPEIIPEPEVIPVPEPVAIPEPEPEPESGYGQEESGYGHEEPEYEYEEPAEETEVKQVAIIEPVKPAVATEHEKPAVVTEDATVNSQAMRGKLVFSINDRYRFKRELFSNSDAEFNNTLALVASMENYDEAEDYFLTELGWDEEAEEVTDFLAVIRKYFV